MSHLKRLASPKTWPIPRKGTKYLTSPKPGKVSSLSMPVALMIRDLLKLSSSRRETRIMLHNKEVLVNGKVVGDTKAPVGLFDVISLPKIKKNYRVTLNDKRKIELEEIKESEAKSKACKVIGKTTLKGNKVQVNLLNGDNVLSDAKVKTNDSLVLDLNKRTVLKHLAFKEGANALIIGGKHLGQRAVIEKVDKNEATLKVGKESFPIKPRNVYVIE